MDLKRLRYFIRIAEDGSLTRASSFLGIAQPALSRQMRLLEEETGATLFTRAARGMRLTDEGEYLRACVAAPLRELELAFQNIRSFPAQVEAQFAIGIAANLAEMLSAPLALHLHATFPKVRFKLIDGMTGSLIDWLGRGIVDFVLIEGSAADGQLRERRLAPLPLVLGGLATSQLPPDKPVRFADAVALPLVQTSHHLGVRSVIDDCMARTRTKLNIAMEADSARLIRELLQNGLGYAILPACYFAAGIGAGGLRTWAIVDPAPEIVPTVASRGNNPLSGGLTGAIEDAIADTFQRCRAGAVPEAS
jgi:DNA-binding transcriptional LysR family regulator